LLEISSLDVASWVIATQDEIGAGFSVSLALASGGSGPFEVGASWTPTFNASPATNNAAVENCILSDSLSNSVAVDQANPLSAPISGHTYTETTQTSVSVRLQETQINPPLTASSPSVGVSWLIRSGYGASNSNTATGATASGNNFDLSDATVLTGTLVNVGVGTIFPSIACAGQYVALLLPHTASPHTFDDNNTGFALPMTVEATFDVTNQLGVVVDMDLYYSSATFNASVAPKVTG
jgi:hypothetical protein